MEAFVLQRLGVLETSTASVNGHLQSIDIRLDDVKQRQAADASNLQVHIDHLEQDVDNISTWWNDIVQMKSKTNEVEGQTVQIGEEVNLLSEDLTELQRQVRDIDNKIERVDDDHTDNFTELHKLVHQELSPSVDNAHAEISALKSENRQLHQLLEVMNARMTALEHKKQEEEQAAKRYKVNHAEARSSFGEVMGVVQTQQIMKLREEVAAIKAKSCEGADLVEHNMQVIHDRCERSAVLLNTMVHRTDEAADIVNSLEDNVVTGLVDNYERMGRDLQSALNQHRDDVDNRLNNLKQNIEAGWHLAQLVFHKAIVDEELQKLKEKNEPVSAVGVFGLALDHPQFRLFHAKNCIISAEKALIEMDKLPMIRAHRFPGDVGCHEVPIMPMSYRRVNAASTIFAQNPNPYQMHI